MLNYILLRCCLALSFIAAGVSPGNITACPPDINKTSCYSSIPVLCYHQIRDWKQSDSRGARTYITQVENFRSQIKMLHDSGYHSILPYQLLAYVNGSAALPSRPVLITFDDGTESQYSNAQPELNKYGFKAVFFIMTVTIGKKDYLSRAQIKELADKGHVIGNHTWDHKMVTKYTGTDWLTEVTQPNETLQGIIHEQVKFFAYPNGAWNDDAVEKLSANGFAAAFQLSGKCYNSTPAFTIKRILVDGHWTPSQLLEQIKLYK